MRRPVDNTGRFSQRHRVAPRIEGQCKVVVEGTELEVPAAHHVMLEPSALAKTLLFIGLAIIALGALIWLTQYLPENFRPFRLPGDIRIERDGFRFYFPITTMVLLSLLGTGVVWLVRWWKGS